MDTSSTLLDAVLAYCERHHLSPSRFGMLVVNDNRLLRRLQQGTDLRLSTVDRINGFLKHPPPPNAPRRIRVKPGTLRTLQDGEA